MKAILSVFNRSAECKNCRIKFKLKKRRQCILCSKTYTEYLFCKLCSIKINHRSLGFLAPKRYCMGCYVSTTTSSNIEGSNSTQVPQIKHEEQKNDFLPSSKSVDIDSDLLPEIPSEVTESILIGLPSDDRVLYN